MSEIHNMAAVQRNPKKKAQGYPPFYSATIRPRTCVLYLVIQQICHVVYHQRALGMKHSTLALKTSGILSSGQVIVHFKKETTKNGGVSFPLNLSSQASFFCAAPTKLFFFRGYYSLNHFYINNLMEPNRITELGVVSLVHAHKRNKYLRGRFQGNTVIRGTINFPIS